MKRILLLSILIASTLLAGAVFYNYKTRMRLKASEKLTQEILKPASLPELALAMAPNIDIQIHDFVPESEEESNISIVEEESCPETELGETFEGEEPYLKGDSKPLTPDKEGEKEKEKLPPYEWLRRELIQEHGDIPEIEQYIGLSRKMRDKEPMEMQEMLTYTRLLVKFNPSEDAKRLHDLLSGLASENVISFSMEHLPP